MSIFYSMLTGRRPDLLTKTLRALPWKPTVYVNDLPHDPQSAEIAANAGCRVEGWEGWLGVQDSMTRIAAQVKGDYWVHIEDDWQHTRPIHLPDCVRFLEDHPEVGQIRFRKMGDGASRRNYITRQRIEWHGSGIVTGNAHATWNPSIIRSEDAALYPVSGEVEFMEKMAAKYPKNASLLPGSFVHLGKGRSLRSVSSWALPPDVLAALEQRLAELSPEVAVETGSGESTRVLHKHSGHSISLEHDIRWYKATRRRNPTADVRYAPLRPVRTPEGPFPFYNAELPPFDFGLIDGPPCRIGRQAAGFVLLPLLKPGGEIWVDDYGDSPHTDLVRDWVALWGKHYDFTVEDHGRYAVLR